MARKASLKTVRTKVSRDAGVLRDLDRPRHVLVDVATAGAVVLEHRHHRVRLRDHRRLTGSLRQRNAGSGAGDRVGDPAGEVLLQAQLEEQPCAFGWFGGAGQMAQGDLEERRRLRVRGGRDGFRRRGTRVARGPAGVAGRHRMVGEDRRVTQVEFLQRLDESLVQT